MPAKNCICVVVDRLHAGMIGAYGNSWIRSDRIDQLAAQSFLFDQGLVAAGQLDAQYRALWFGEPAFVRRQRGGTSFAGLVNSAGWQTALVTDDPRVARMEGAADFDNQLLVELPTDAASAADPSQTRMARVFGAATDWLRTPREPFCLWLHVRGMADLWDAPWDFRARYADEDDPEPPRFVEVPDRTLPEDYDPDELLGITHAYAAQVSLFDLCVGALVDQLQESGLDATTQLTLLSARGFPLGEHLRVGPCDEPLYNELAQLVWLMRFPDGTGQLDRSQALVGPADLSGTLLDWLAIGEVSGGEERRATLLPIIRGDEESIRDRAAMISIQERALRTPAWLLRESAAGPPELYAKPGDRWEVNEVAKLCPEIVDGLQAALREMSELAEAGKMSELAPLSEDLVTQVD